MPAECACLCCSPQTQQKALGLLASCSEVWQHGRASAEAEMDQLQLMYTKSWLLAMRSKVLLVKVISAVLRPSGSTSEHVPFSGKCTPWMPLRRKTAWTTNPAGQMIFYLDWRCSTSSLHSQQRIQPSVVCLVPFYIQSYTAACVDNPGRVSTPEQCM